VIASFGSFFAAFEAAKDFLHQGTGSAFCGAFQGIPPGGIILKKLLNLGKVLKQVFSERLEVRRQVSCLAGNNRDPI
jgi:hypothetical protein